MVSSLLDVLSGARTEQSILSALEFLNMPSNNDLDLCERFLTSLAASCVTASAQPQSNPITSAPSLRFIVEELFRLVQRDQRWLSSKVKLTTIMTLASVLKSSNDLTRHKRESLPEKKRLDTETADEELTHDVIKTIVKELEKCSDTECKVSLLHALGNAGNLEEAIDMLEKFALNVSERRESIVAMKAIRDCLEVHKKAARWLENDL